MPIMGLIFLRHATNRFYAAKAAIEADKAAGKMPDRPLVEADFTRRRALNLPESARFDAILKTPKDGNLGAALTSAMEAIEAAFPPLTGQLPKDYGRFEGSVLEDMMRMFDSEGLRTASGDVFGRIYEYFLAEFSKQRAHDNGNAGLNAARIALHPLGDRCRDLTKQIAARHRRRCRRKRRDWRWPRPSVAFAKRSQTFPQRHHGQACAYGTQNCRIDWPRPAGARDDRAYP
jgi:HsdM N-terminal domain